MKIEQMMKTGMALATWSVLAVGCVAEEAQEGVENVTEVSSAVSFGLGNSCSGTTPAAWQQLSAQTIYLDVDTSACGYTEVPLYFTSLEKGWRTMGATAIKDDQSTINGFRVYVSNLSGISAADANTGGMDINWEAIPDQVRMPELCTGRTGSTAWQQVDAQTLSIDVDTSACGYTEMPDYFTSLGGTYGHRWATGVNTITAPSVTATATGFKVYVYYPNPITPADANTWNWHINWQATPRDLRTAHLCTGATSPWVSAWWQHPTSPNGVCLDVDTSACGFTTTPRYFASMGDAAYSPAVDPGVTGISSIYAPGTNGFRVCVYDPNVAITPAYANAASWHIQWKVIAD